MRGYRRLSDRELTWRCFLSLDLYECRKEMDRLHNDYECIWVEIYLETNSGYFIEVTLKDETEEAIFIMRESD
jgi:hypothetical protein